jgi:hypothetical protein
VQEAAVEAGLPKEAACFSWRSRHNVWHGLPMILTFIGYALMLKCLVYFVFPKIGLKSLSRVSIEKSWEFVVAGIFSIALSVLLTFMHIL